MAAASGDASRLNDGPEHGARSRKHPEMAAYQALSEAAFARYPDTTTLPLPIAREIQEEVGRGFARGGPEMAETVERLPQVHGRHMLVRCHSPVPGRPLPVLVYLHGGGWRWNSIYTHDRLIRSYAAASGLCAVAPDYSLSPESRFPTAVEECVALVHWLARRRVGPRSDAARDRRRFGGREPRGRHGAQAARCRRPDAARAAAERRRL